MQSKPLNNTVLLVYTEQTPNPESLKFVTNQMLYKGVADFKDREMARRWSPLAERLYGEDYVQSVYISNNFVTITKTQQFDWSEIMLPAKELVKSLVEAGTKIVDEGYAEFAQSQLQPAGGGQYSERDSEIVQRIRDMIDTYVRPAVEMDGGNIEFKHYEDGIVTVMMQGSCSGCPSSTVTLKAGIEGLLKRMVPEVQEVVAEAE
ncbi:MAG: NifU family protein [Saprospiraceae bacterium]|jgi:Fe-S cluster biogenesis protein NfuA|nr:NifU family protein [Saprospiraceae bacterium]MBP9209781.1 NifU family protein [Saprospiraceae bacterium]MBV6473337.1 Fe/S biogenesis protein NfuA [Saprospiraceae bacterium]